ncbi:MAG: hypothetical protein Q9201_005684 [Fulgogasparrea decipioides]
MYLSLLAVSFLSWQLVTGQIPTSSSNAPTPTCLQPRQPTGTAQSAIVSVLASAIPEACDPQRGEFDVYQSNFIRTHHIRSYDFNISQDVANQVAPPASLCTNAFRSIVSACVDSPFGPGFWGGWILLEASNYSISDPEYPKNARLSASSAPSGPTIISNPEGISGLVLGTTSVASGYGFRGPAGTVHMPGETGFPPSGSANVVSGAAHTGLSYTGSHPEETESFPIRSTGVAAGTGRTNPGNAVGTASEGAPDFSSQPDLSYRQSDASGYTFSGTGSGTGPIGQPTFSGGPSATHFSNSGGFPDPTNLGPSGAASASGANPSNSLVPSVSEIPANTASHSGTKLDVPGTVDPSNEPSGFEPVTTGPVQTSRGSVYSSASSISGLSEGLIATSERGGGDTDPFGSNTWTSTPIRSTGVISSLNTGAPSVSGDPSSQQVGDQSSQGTVDPSNPNAGNTETSSSRNLGDPGNTATGGGPEPQTTRPNSGPITPPPAIPTMSIGRESPEASSEGIIIGGLLSRLSNSAKSYSTDITIPAAKTAFLEDIDDTEHELETLFKNLGGSLPPDTGGCSSGGGGGLGDLIGDIFNTVRCAINSVNTLKGHVDIPEPDFPTIERDLVDVGTLAENIDENDDNNDEDDDDDDDDDSSTNDQNSTKESSSNEPSTKDPTSPDPSSRFSTSRQPSSASASTTGTSSSTGDTCGGCCPTDVPALPTDGTPAVTAAPTEFDTLDKRVFAPGRLHRHIKRKPDAAIVAINKCALQTPNGFLVTIPAYPGGFEFYNSDIRNQLGSLTTISRYYRSTTVGSPACTPTITRIDAAGWTFSQSGNVAQNDRISVDHAYEIGFLKSFMESIIDQTGGMTCKDANVQFFDKGNCPDNRMEPIFGSLPSFKNPDFIAMSQWLNGDAKGWVLGPSYDPQLGGANLPVNKVRPFDSWKNAMDKVKRKMALAQILVEAALIINADNTIAAMQKTNNRIYAAFKAYDTYLSQHAGLPQANFGWAAKYKTYMDKYVNFRNGASSSLLAPLLTTVGNDLNIAKNNVANKIQAELDQWTNLHAAMTSYYTGSGAGASELNWAITWEWNTANVKRSEFENPIFKRQACSRPTGTATGAATASASASKEDGGSTIISDATSTKGPSPTTSSPPPSQTCFNDFDCNDYKCSSGDPFCAIAISKHRKRETPCIALGTCPGMDIDDKAEDDKDESDSNPAETTGELPPEAFPTGFCGCKNQDPAPSKTENLPTSTQPPPEGCTNGLYDNMDDCGDHCKQGLCQENAGQPQITCACN